jgi:hypothetical protein
MLRVELASLSCRNLGRIVTRIAALSLIAGSALTFTSADLNATPDKVTKNTPCGSCHPANKPPKRK